MDVLAMHEAMDIAKAALFRVGAVAETAEVQARHLMRADAKGHPSHGLMRLPRLVARIENGVASANATGTHAWSARAVLEVDGQMGLGPVVVYAAIEALKTRLDDTGVALAVIDNCNHLGMLSNFVEDLAKDGLVAIMVTTSEALVHPWGGRRAMIGTNPIAIGVPSKPTPFVIDLATSKISMGKVHAYADTGRDLEEGWAIDADGNRTCDAAAAKTGALAPFGDAKGYALGLAFEVLIGVLTNSALGHDVVGTLDSTEVCNKGDVIILAKPRSSSALTRVTAYLEALRKTPPEDPERPVRVPGDGADIRRRRSSADGITIPLPLLQELRSLARV